MIWAIISSIGWIWAKDVYKRQSLVNEYIIGKQVITQNTLGGLKTACIAGQPDPVPLPENLELGKLNLQDYFIQLMNKEDSDHE